MCRGDYSDEVTCLYKKTASPVTRETDTQGLLKQVQVHGNTVFLTLPAFLRQPAARQTYCSQHAHGELPVKTDALALARLPVMHLRFSHNSGTDSYCSTQKKKKKQQYTQRHLCFQHWLHPFCIQSTKSPGVSHLNLLTALLLHSHDDVYRDRIINTQKKKKRRGKKFSFGILSNILCSCLTSEKLLLVQSSYLLRSLWMEALAQFTFTCTALLMVKMYHQPG